MSDGLFICEQMSCDSETWWTAGMVSCKLLCDSRAEGVSWRWSCAVSAACYGRIGCIIHDGEQFAEWPPVSHWLTFFFLLYEWVYWSCCRLWHWWSSPDKPQLSRWYLEPEDFQHLTAHIWQIWASSRSQVCLFPVFSFDLPASIWLRRTPKHLYWLTTSTSSSMMHMG